MEIIGIEKVSMVDYPNKIATTLFTGGCNFRCPFCHNSGIVEKRYSKYNDQYIFDYLNSRKGLIDAVVVSGGEPTLQKDLVEFVTTLKEMGFLIKLDTNGSNPFVLKKLLDKKLLDYVAIDIKNNFDDYDKITGVKGIRTDNIKTSLQLLKKYDVDYELRTTLVKEFHDENNIEQMAKELKGEKILYLQKFVASKECFSDGLNAVPKLQASHFATILSKNINNVYLRGY